MNKSESIKELATALSKLQGEIKDVTKNRKGRFEYADISAFFDVARPLLEKNGLAVTQLVSNSGDNISIETVLMHSSGEWISSAVASPVYKGQSGNPLQDIGGVITYLKRYSFSALLCFDKTDEDDDAESLTGAAHAKHEQKPYNLAVASVAPVQPVEHELITKEQTLELSKLMFEAKVDSRKFFESYKIKSLAEMRQDSFNNAAGRLRATIAKKASPAPADYANV